MERKLVTFEDVERRLIEMARVAYYSWIRHVVTLSSGALTLLVGLRNNYVPANPRALLLLKLCWVGLALSILLGVVALFGEAQTPVDAAMKLRIDRKKYGDQVAAQMLDASSGILPKKRYIYAQKGLYWSFAISLILLCLFALLNL